MIHNFLQLFLLIKLKNKVQIQEQATAAVEKGKEALSAYMGEIQKLLNPTDEFIKKMQEQFAQTKIVNQIF